MFKNTMVFNCVKSVSFLLGLNALFTVGYGAYGYEPYGYAAQPAGRLRDVPRVLPEVIAPQHSDTPPVFLNTPPQRVPPATTTTTTTTTTRTLSDIQTSTQVPAVLDVRVNTARLPITTTTTTTTSRVTSGTTRPTDRLPSASASGSGSGGLVGNAIFGSGSGSSDGGGGVGSFLSILGTPVTTKAPKPVKPGNFDKHLDAIIVNLGKALRKNGFDPVRIGNLQQCTNCTLEGLSLIRRGGPSNLVYANRTVTVDAHLILPALYISCFPCIDVILMVPLSGMLEVALWGLQIYGKVSQKVSKGESPSLIAYEVENEGDLDIRLNGHGLLGPLTEFGFKIIRQRTVSDIIREFVYERVPKFIRRRLKGFSFPIGK